jgi:hypothetical protein
VTRRSHLPAWPHTTCAPPRFLAPVRLQLQLCSIPGCACRCQAH